LNKQAAQAGQLYDTCSEIALITSDKCTKVMKHWQSDFDWGLLNGLSKNKGKRKHTQAN